MRLTTLLVASLLVLCVGCTTDIGDTVHRKGLRTVSVSRLVNVQGPLRGAFDAHTGNVTVVAAGAIVDALDRNKIEKLRVAMQENGIDIPDMVHAQVSEILENEKGFQIVTNASDAVLNISIRQYGFDGGNSANSKNTPFIELSARLIDKRQVLWKGVAAAPPLRPGNPKAKLQEYQTQPALLREHWRIQINKTARKLLTAE